MCPARRARWPTSRSSWGETLPSECLVFHLSGPLASWGEVAIGTRRPSDDHPSLSAIVGILCAAKGVTRSEDSTIKAFEQRYDYVAVAADGASLMADYHTVQSIRETDLKKQVPTVKKNRPVMLPGLSRADELATDNPQTILTDREYVCNGRYSVFVIPHDDAPFPLSDLRDALERPVFTPYLGRKSCPLSIRMAPEVVVYQRLWDAVCRYGLKPFRQPDADCSCRVFSTYALSDGPTSAVQTRRRQDLSVSRRNWLFSSRQEFQYYVRSLNDVHQQNAAN